jgi:multidrug efflux pump
VVKSDADAGHREHDDPERPAFAAGTLTDIATNQFKERFQTIPGVSTVQIWGEKKYSMKLLLDPLKMAGLGMTPLDVNNALAGRTWNCPAEASKGRTPSSPSARWGGSPPRTSSTAMIIRDDGGNRGAHARHRQGRTAAGE